MVTKPPPKFLSRAVLLGSILRLRRIDHAELLQLDHRRTDQLPLSLPSINLVDRAHFCKQISGVQRISEESWQVFAKYPWRAARGFQRQEGGGALIKCEEMSAASKNSYMLSYILIVGVAFFQYVIYIYFIVILDRANMQLSSTARHSINHYQCIRRKFYRNPFKYLTWHLT